MIVQELLRAVASPAAVMPGFACALVKGIRGFADWPVVWNAALGNTKPLTFRQHYRIVRIKTSTIEWLS